MSIKTRPPQPGFVLRQRVLARSDITQAQLAGALGISKVRLSQILNGHAPISTEVALRLGRVTNIPAEEWWALQVEHDLDKQRKRLADKLDQLPRLMGATGSDAQDGSSSETSA